MNTTRTCGCRSFRSCYICETQFGIKRVEDPRERLGDYSRLYYYSPSRACLLESEESLSEEEGLPFPGLKVIPDFISPQEEEELVRDLNELPWETSQSGRRKQNFGPRANFNKRKAKAGNFRGFPRCSRFVHERFPSIPCLRDYWAVEQCSIEYRPETGSCINPHIDDCWIWGERVVQLNLLSDTYLTCLPYRGEKTKYNLPDVAKYPRIMDDQDHVVFNPFESENRDQSQAPYELKPAESLLDGVVKVPLPRRSLLVFFGEPRYDWEHCILREDIHDRRIVIAYREFTPPYLPGGTHYDIGREVLEKAKLFW